MTFEQNVILICVYVQVQMWRYSTAGLFWQRGIEYAFSGFYLLNFAVRRYMLKKNMLKLDLVGMN